MLTKDEVNCSARERYAADPERYRKRTREYNRAHKEERAEYTRNYRLKNPEKVELGRKLSRARYPERAAAYAKAYRKRHPARHKATAKRNNLKKFGLTPASRGLLFGIQEGRCWICKNILDNAKHTHIDHDHKTGQIRGLLCTLCNFMVGHAKDNQEILMAGAEYLKTAVRIFDFKQKLIKNG